MDSEEKERQAEAEIYRLYQQAKRLKDQWNSNKSIDVYALGACAAAADKLTHLTFNR